MILFFSSLSNVIKKSVINLFTNDSKLYSIIFWYLLFTKIDNILLIISKYPVNIYSLISLSSSKIVVSNSSKNEKISSFFESLIDTSYKSLNSLKKRINWPLNAFKFLNSFISLINSSFSIFTNNLSFSSFIYVNIILFIKYKFLLVENTPDLINLI